MIAVPSQKQKTGQIGSGGAAGEAGRSNTLAHDLGGLKPKPDGSKSGNFGPSNSYFMPEF